MVSPPGFVSRRRLAIRIFNYKIGLLSAFLFCSNNNCVSYNMTCSYILHSCFLCEGRSPGRPLVPHGGNSAPDCLLLCVPDLPRNSDRVPRVHRRWQCEARPPCSAPFHTNHHAAPPQQRRGPQKRHTVDGWLFLAIQV